MTGCYPNRIGISGALFPRHEIGINPDELTIAEMLKAEGYATAIFGKWHLGHHKEFLPLQHGFDEYVGVPYSNDMWPIRVDGTRFEPGEGRGDYPDLPLIEGNETIEYIKHWKDRINSPPFIPKKQLILSTGTAAILSFYMFLIPCHTFHWVFPTNSGEKANRECMGM